MSLRAFRLGTAVWYSVLLWVLGFVWGVIVFMVPPLEAVQSIPYFLFNSADYFTFASIWVAYALFIFLP